MIEIGEAWYFYAGPCEYVCRLDLEGKIPARFHGPYESKEAAIIGYREWLLEKLESDDEPE